MEKYVSYDDLFKIEHYVRTKQWWDTIDSLMKFYGYKGSTSRSINAWLVKRSWQVGKTSCDWTSIA